MLNSIELEKQRVSNRVKEGGHHIDKEKIERRYIAGIKNLFEIYLPIVDGAFLFDNSDGNHALVAQKIVNKEMVIVNEEKFNILKQQYDNH